MQANDGNFFKWEKSEASLAIDEQAYVCECSNEKL